MIDSPADPRFRVLGPLEIRGAQGWTPVGPRKWRALMAALLLRPGQVVSTDQLIEELWGECPPATAANLVSVYVHRLRKLLADPGGTVLVTRAPGYLAAVAAGELDAACFVALVSGARAAVAADPERAVVSLTEALGLWRGPALADVDPTPLVRAEADRLTEARVSALALRAEAELVRGRPGEAIPELRRLLADSPLREELWALLLRALVAAGRPAAALEAYEQARRVISDELGVDPGVDLRGLYQRILAGDTAALMPPAGGSASPAGRHGAVTAPPAAADAAAGESGGASPVAGVHSAATLGARVPPPARPEPERVIPAQLPADIADFTGRAEQVAALRALLTELDPDSPGVVRIALVVGSGGLGKSALAVHAAHLVAAGYPDGQLFAHLAGATQPASPGEVLARFLRDLGVDPARVPASDEERAAAYRTRLSGKRVLIVLDDARDASQVIPLLPGSAACAVLVTARGQLPELPGARSLDLEVLSPAEARALFGRVAGEARLAAEPDATGQVLAACAGLPLAIRIVGAKLATRTGWSVAALAGRLSDERRRLDELRVGNLAVRACFEVSYASLPSPGPASADSRGQAGQAGAEAPPPGPARVFRLLGVWAGPSISLPAAAALCGMPEEDAADALDILLDTHLLESPAPDLYRFHDLLRVYAADRALTQEPDQDRHAAIIRVLTWYLHTVEAASSIISPHHARVPLVPLPSGVRPLSFPSVDCALSWCESERSGLAAAARLAVSAGLTDLAWQLPAAAMSYYFRRNHWTDWVATHTDGLDAARQAGNRHAEAWMLNNLGIAYGQQRLPDGVGCFERALDLYRAVGDGLGESKAAVNVAQARYDIGDYRAALHAGERALEIHRREGKPYGTAITLAVVGCSARDLGLFTDAVEYLRQALAIFRELGETSQVAEVLSDLGEAYLGVDQVDRALECLRESVPLYDQNGPPQQVGVALRRLGDALRRAGEDGPAREALTKAVQIFENMGDRASAAVALASLRELDPAEPG